MPKTKRVIANNPEWTLEPKVESLLADWRLSYVVELVSITDVDEKASLSLQHRSDILISGLVDDYAKDMQANNAFPAGVSYRPDPKKSKVVLLGGNHRFLAARKAGRKSMLLYIVATEDQTITMMLPRALNYIEGVRVDKGEVIHAAADAVMKLGLSVEEVSKKMKVAKASVREVIDARKMRKKLNDIGAPSGFPKETLIAMKEIKNTNVLKDFAYMAKSAKFTAVETKSHAKDLLSVEDTEAGQLSAVREKARQLGTIADGTTVPKPPVFRQPIFTELKRALSLLKNVLRGKQTLEQLQATTPTDKTYLIGEFNEACSTIRKILSNNVVSGRTPSNATPSNGKRSSYS